MACLLPAATSSPSSDAQTCPGLHGGSSGTRKQTQWHKVRQTEQHQQQQQIDDAYLLSGCSASCSSSTEKQVCAQQTQLQIIPTSAHCQCVSHGSSWPLNLYKALTQQCNSYNCKLAGCPCMHGCTPLSPCCCLPNHSPHLCPPCNLCRCGYPPPFRTPSLPCCCSHGCDLVPECSSCWSARAVRASLQAVYASRPQPSVYAGAAAHRVDS